MTRVVLRWALNVTFCRNYGSESNVPKYMYFHILNKISDLAYKLHYQGQRLAIRSSLSMRHKVSDDHCSVSGRRIPTRALTTNSAESRLAIAQ